MVCLVFFCQGTKYAWENGMSSITITIILQNVEGEVGKKGYH